MRARRAGAADPPGSRVPTPWPGNPFAEALVDAAFAPLVFGTPLAIFLTSFGDCLSASCPGASAIDRAISALDVLIVVILGALLLRWSTFGTVGFLVAGAAGLVVAVQGIAAVASARELVAFSILLPAAGFLLAGSLAGLRGLWLGRDPWPATVGCLPYLAIVTVAFVGSVAVSAARDLGAGNPVGALLLALLVVAAALVLGLVRRARR
jgi:hypothetical protein